jgi:hypothetical protein
MVACSAALPEPSETAALVTRTVGPWHFREAAHQPPASPEITIDAAEQAAFAHLADEYTASIEELTLSEALYRRGLESIDAFGGGAQGMPAEDAWVLRFSLLAEPEKTAGWVVVGPGGQIKASWFEH